MGQGCVFHQRKTRGVTTNVYSSKRSEKPRDDGLNILKIKFRELFTHGEGISTPCVCHKGRQPLIECARLDFNIMYLPFLCFFHLFVVDKGVSLTPTYSSIAMRKSNLRSSFRSERWLSCYLFWKIDFRCEQNLFKTLDLERSLDFWKKRIIKALDLEWSLDFGRGESLRHWTLNDLKCIFCGQKFDLWVDFSLSFTWLILNSFKENFQSKCPIETRLFND